MDRSSYPTRKTRLEDEIRECQVPGTAEERMAMVWQLTLQAWEFATWNQPEGNAGEQRLLRDVVRIVRPAG